MRYIKRLEEPEILVSKKAEWTQKFIESGNKRPDNSKYGHKAIKELLFTMSHNKCYYCETLLSDRSSEIDHFIEVAEQKSMAFEWYNLYLACDNCNNKVPNKSIPVASALNPCIDTDDEIEENIIFEDEQISFLTEKGEMTIQKYKLSSPLLDTLRLKQLTYFHKKLLEIKDKQIAENRKGMNQDELNQLKRFAKNDYPFSLMFK